MEFLSHADNTLQAYLLKGWFEQQGIAVQIRGEVLGGAVGELPTEVLQPQLWTDIEHLDKAQILLKSWQSEPSSSLWFCRHCSEENPTSFDTCWSCGTESQRNT
nr:DUF2007 domain-containing protein [Echinimonas agarilytica]